uniref:Uncharacterized protein n=1 Tax=Panagrolaimus sp. PS1159 TaxID=55785 RepID=A0AC35FFF0_9BILA
MFHSINSSCKILTTISRFSTTRQIQTLTKSATAAAALTPQTIKYKPLPCYGTFNLDHRKNNNRKVIEDGYKPDGAEDIQICFELLDENDIEFMTQYVVEHFIKHSNICKHLGLKGEELIEIIHPQVVQWISSKNSIIVKHDEKIIGASFGSLHDRKEFDSLYRGQLFHDNPKFVIKEDYGEECGENIYI